MIMKIAIKGDELRGKEVIQILESLGGVNVCPLKGDAVYLYYYINYDCNNAIHCHDVAYVNKYCKKYTLEEFEKEFPFKIGDKVRHITSIGTIRKYCYMDNKPGYEVESMELGIIANIPAEILEPYKEMKEERNITLSLDKAKEWYHKGGELKEIALQAFSEKELNPLPRSWEEFCKDGYWHIRYPEKYKALFKLEKLRDCWRQGWKPDWNDAQQTKYCVVYHCEEFEINIFYEIKHFLSFPTIKMAKEFLECFKNLIEQARDLI